MQVNKFHFYEFGEFQLDARRRCLVKNGKNIPLSARYFDLLLFMVENSGRVLEHDELLEKVWAGIFVEQTTLKKGISALRQILAENPENEFIKTIPRQGYSFVSPVRGMPDNRGNVFVRESEREIIIEEYEVIDESRGESRERPEIIKILPASKQAVLPASSPRYHPVRVIGYLAAGIVVLSGLFFGLRPYFIQKNQLMFSAESVRITRLTSSGNVRGAAISPDGSYVVYPLAEKDGWPLWLRQVSVNSAVRLTTPVQVSFFGYGIAPDNSYVYYILNDITEPEKTGLYKIPLLGGEPQLIGQRISNFAISPDGKKLAVVETREGTNGTIILTISPNGEDEHTITILPANLRLWSIAWTPDGSALLCAIRKEVDDKNLFYVAEFSPENGKESIVLPEQEKAILSAEWLPDKSALLLTEREMNADICQIRQYFPSSGEWRRVTNDNNNYRNISVTRDGKTIALTQTSRLSEIWISDDGLLPVNNPNKKSISSDENEFRQISQGINSFDKIGWLSDGHIFYSATENDKESIFTTNPDGTNARQITNGDDGTWTFPTNTNDSRSISFMSGRTGSRQVWRIDPDGKNPTQITGSKLTLIDAHILHNNSTVFFSASSKTGGARLYKQTADGQTTQLTTNETGMFAISPDEKLLAIQLLNEDTQKYYVELRSLEENKPLKIFEITPGRRMIFTPDGKNLFYDYRRNDAGQLMIQPLDGSEPKWLTNFQSEEIFDFALSTDGKRIAVVRGRQLSDVVLIR